MIKFSKAIAGRLRTAARRIAGEEEGTATIEFVLFFPLFMTVFMSAFESGLLMTRQVMLERAMDLSIRNLRLGLWDDPANPPTAEMLKQEICAWATVIPDCMDSLMMELRPVSTATWTPLDPNITCVERDEVLQPVVEFNVGVENEMMLVRACAVFDPIFRSSAWGLNLPLDPSGGYQLAATSAFVNEPD